MRELDDITEQEKIETFDRLYKMCRHHADRYLDKTASCDVDCDCSNYIFEAIMMAALGKDIFKTVN